MKRFKIRAEFYVQADSSNLAEELAQDMLNDMVSEQCEDVEKVEIIGEVEQTAFHRTEDDEEDEEDEEDAE